jgi:hypothetical protein
MDWKRKLTSRKLWLAIADFVGMLIIAFGYAESTATQVTSIIMAGAGVIGYLIAEGLADGANGTTTIVEEKTVETESETE